MLILILKPDNSDGKGEYDKCVDTNTNVDSNTNTNTNTNTKTNTKT